MLDRLPRQGTGCEDCEISFVIEPFDGRLPPLFQLVQEFAFRNDHGCVIQSHRFGAGTPVDGPLADAVGAAEQIGAFKDVPDERQCVFAQHNCGQPGTSSPFERGLETGLPQQIGTTPCGDGIAANQNAEIFPARRRRHEWGWAEPGSLFSRCGKSNDENLLFVRTADSRQKLIDNTLPDGYPANQPRRQQAHRVVPDPRSARRVEGTLTSHGGNRKTEFWVWAVANRLVIKIAPFEARPTLRFGLSGDGKKIHLDGVGSSIEVFDGETLESRKLIS